MEEPKLVYENDDFMNHMKSIASNEYIIVIDKLEKIKGILTTYDMTLNFYDFINPYLRIGIIESKIRELLVKAGIKSESKVHDLTFYQYQKLLEDKSNWQKVGLENVDQESFVKKLEQIRFMRNRNAHYKPNKINDSEQFLIKSFANFLQGVST